MESWGLVLFAGVMLVGAWYITRVMSEQNKRGKFGNDSSEA